MSPTTSPHHSWRRVRRRRRPTRCRRSPPGRRPRPGPVQSDSSGSPPQSGPHAVVQPCGHCGAFRGGARADHPNAGRPGRRPVDWAHGLA
ncbi:MAG: hypothetical protein EOL91_07805 [Actinobacteria bacterium]|nr:hypothetical protein [Actinomycetota bacterium]